MKTIFAFAAFAVASLGVASTAGAQTLSPYVGLEYTTTPTEEGTQGGIDYTDTWFGGNASTTVVVGAEADLPWDVTVDGNIRFANDMNKIGVVSTDDAYDASALDLGGFGIDGAGFTLSKEVLDGLEVFSTTMFDEDFDRSSTSVGAKWKF